MLSNLSTLWALSHVRRKLTEKKDIKHPSCSAIWSHSTAMEVANWPNWENRATSSTSSANLVLNPTGIRSTERRPACGGGFGNLLTINCVIGCHLWHYADQDLIFFNNTEPQIYYNKQYVLLTVKYNARNTASTALIGPGLYTIWNM